MSLPFYAPQPSPSPKPSPYPSPQPSSYPSPQPSSPSPSPQPQPSETCPQDCPQSVMDYFDLENPSHTFKLGNATNNDVIAYFKLISCPTLSELYEESEYNKSNSISWSSYNQTLLGGITISTSPPYTLLTMIKNYTPNNILLSTYYSEYPTFAPMSFQTAFSIIPSLKTASPTIINPKFLNAWIQIKALIKMDSGLINMLASTYSTGYVGNGYFNAWNNLYNNKKFQININSIYNIV